MSFRRLLFGLALVLLNPAADVGMEANQVINRGVLGMGFEGVGHPPN